MGYAVSRIEIPKETNNKSYVSVQTALYLYLHDNTLVFVPASTALKKLFDIFKRFGTPSKNNGLVISIILTNEGNKSYYLFDILGRGKTYEGPLTEINKERLQKFLES
ncbi:hypothetical protein [Bartonella harrusi]|uniref:Uncharacterized protein n=1 Tax=Bartonella harrusi TaxID=2961895 RepID=A0ABY5EUZ3_9HYPH|nr:hypothetical protein [Bartonella harrusi]UTO28240.1 hypothetical protein NMK50_08845 [Bartonella harrusi]